MSGPIECRVGGRILDIERCRGRDWARLPVDNTSEVDGGARAGLRAAVRDRTAITSESNQPGVDL
jgi:hypothetical protein